MTVAGNRQSGLFIPILIIALLSVCGDGSGSSDAAISPLVTDEAFEVTDWTEATHSNDVDPNYAEVFDDTEVKRFDFVVTPERWQIMLDVMTATYGAFGQRTSAGGLLDTEVDPVFVPADVYYGGKQWYRVGIRFMGNSSLQSSWQSGVLKLAFKMDLDEFEDDYPQIDNQRFYGFKKFSLKNHYDDPSQLREKVAADVFAKAGMAVSDTAFYTPYIDQGNGPATAKVTWIPWNHNEALQVGKQGGALSLDFSSIQAGGWPLIRRCTIPTPTWSGRLRPPSCRDIPSCEGRLIALMQVRL